MTTFDPQPQSRRAVRQNERAENENGFVPFPPNSAPNYYPDGNASRDMWDTTARRAAQLPQQAAPTGSGRRAATPPPAAAEPLTYSTQARDQVPAVDATPVAARPEPDLPPTQAIPRQDQPQYRVRDFSPEGRRPQMPAAWAAPAQPAADLDYHTEARIAPAPPAPVAAPAPAPAAADQTLSRRELRAMQQAEQDAAMAAQTAAAAAVPPLIAPPQPAPAQPQPAAPQPAFSQPEPDPVIAPEPSVPYPVEPPPLQEPPARSDAPSAFPFAVSPSAAPQGALAQPAQAAPVEAAPAQPWQQAAPPQPWQSDPSPLPPVAPQPTADTALNNAIAEFDALTGSQQPVAQQAPATPQEASPWTPPTGHWATQLDADDDPFENTYSRTINSGHTATNALVLPGMPKDTDIRGPLTSTGEVMLTGSIDLPRSLASTGSTDLIEHDGIDALFDVNDHEINSTDSSPVRAIRAVSTHNSGHGVTHTQKPKGTKALTVLLITGAAMAVVVVGLLVSAFAFNVF